MRNWNPRRLWNEVREALLSWLDADDDEEQAKDPSLLFHLLFSVPLLLALLATLRRVA